jgi:hypothetical protein
VNRCRISDLALALVAVGLAACETQAGRQAQEKAAERARIEKAAAVEINRVCALPEEEREAELKKIKEQSGVVLFCGSK